MTSEINPANPKVTLVAIAKNECFYITEWIVYNLLIGFQAIMVFNNDSTDATFELLTRIAELDPRVSVIDWPSKEGISPQLSAYNHAVSVLDTEWVAFLDIDEFIVPWRDQSVPKFLAAVPADVSSMHINWRGFGSNGVISPDYAFVTETFTACSERTWANNYHYKTLVRRKAIDEVQVHYAIVREGHRCLSDFSQVPPANFGIADEVVYNGIHINHYQCKTYAEFHRRMDNGDVFTGLNHPEKFRDGSYRRFLELDRNEESDDKIRQFLPQMRIAFTVFEKFLPAELRSGELKSKWIRETPFARIADYDVSKGPGQSYFFLTYHGTLLARHEPGDQFEQRSIPDAQGNPAVSIRSNLGLADLRGLRLQNYLTELVVPPKKIPLSNLFFDRGSIAKTISITGDGRFLKALPDGSVTMDEFECRDWECLLLMNEAELDLLGHIVSNAWNMPAGGLSVRPEDIEITSGFRLRLAGSYIDLRELPSLPSAAVAGPINLRSVDGTPIEISRADTPDDMLNARAETRIGKRADERSSRHRKNLVR